MSAEVWVGLVAVVVAVAAIALERRHARKGRVEQQDQADALARLVSIEEARALKEADPERRAEEAEVDRRQALLVADVVVRVPAWASNEARYLRVENTGPHDAVLTGGTLWNGQRAGPGVRESWVLADPVIVQPRGWTTWPIHMVGSGQAWAEVTWSDGRGDQTRTFTLELPPHDRRADRWEGRRWR